MPTRRTVTRPRSPTVSTTNGAAAFSNTAAGTTVTLGGTTVNLLDTAHGPFFVPGSSTLDVADVQLTSTTPIGPTGDNFKMNYNLTLSLTNTGPPGTTQTDSFTVSGTITVTNLNMGNGTIMNVFNTPTSGSNIPIGGVLYTGAIGINPDGSNAFASPTVNGSTWCHRRLRHRQHGRTRTGFARHVGCRLAGRRRLRDHPEPQGEPGGLTCLLRSPSRLSPAGARCVAHSQAFLIDPGSMLSPPGDGMDPDLLCVAFVHPRRASRTRFHVVTIAISALLPTSGSGPVC